MQRLGTCCIALGLFTLIGCATSDARRTSPATHTTAACSFPTACRFPAPAPYTPTAQQQELDNIFTLLAYSIVFRYWQTTADESSSRGYNVGSVLVDSENNIVCWAVNSVNITGNSTNHGELRLMTNYLDNTNEFSLPGYTVYTTLEPCAMCGGMMTLQSIAKTVYGQHDPDYGGAINRLEINSTSINGFCPYPRGVVTAEATTVIADGLDEAYCLFYTSQTSPSITEWLASPAAKLIFAAADDTFQNTFSVSFPENQQYLNAARAFLAGLPPGTVGSSNSGYLPIPYTTNCSPASSGAR